MHCESCDELHFNKSQGAWACCGQLHCQHIERCPSCNIPRPISIKVKPIKEVTHEG